jgi:hypothetical protein
MGVVYLHLFTPRWHGWARWQTEIYRPLDRRWTGGVASTLAHLDVLESGWTRRKRDAKYQLFELEWE